MQKVALIGISVFFLVCSCQGSFEQPFHGKVIETKVRSKIEIIAINLILNDSGKDQLLFEVRSNNYKNEGVALDEVDELLQATTELCEKMNVDYVGFSVFPQGRMDPHTGDKRYYYFKHDRVNGWKREVEIKRFWAW